MVLSKRLYIYPGSVSVPTVKLIQFIECTNSILVPVFSTAGQRQTQTNV